MMKNIRPLYLRANLSTFLFAVLTAIALVFIAAAQEKVVTVKKGPVAYTNPASASEMYAAYCAV